MKGRNNTDLFISDIILRENLKQFIDNLLESVFRKIARYEITFKKIYIFQY